MQICDELDQLTKELAEMMRRGMVCSLIVLWLLIDNLQGSVLNVVGSMGISIDYRKSVIFGGWG